MNFLFIFYIYLVLFICDSNEQRSSKNRSQQQVIQQQQNVENILNQQNQHNFHESSFLLQANDHRKAPNKRNHQNSVRSEDKDEGMTKPKHHSHHHHHHHNANHHRANEQSNLPNPLSNFYRYRPNSSPLESNNQQFTNQFLSQTNQKHSRNEPSTESSSSTNGRKYKSKQDKAFTFRALRKEKKKPNIIFMLTDDQDVEMNSMQYMPKTRRILVEGGVEARHAYVTTPMCCPSRSSILTGLYAHNHNVYSNGENCSSTVWHRTHEKKTFATYLRDSGYRTAYFGKYLNEYNGSYIPPGWADWSGLVRNSRYYNYTLNVNGDKIRHGDDYLLDYYPDLILNDTLQYMRYSKRFFSSRPYLIVMSFPSPHGTEDAAPQYQQQFFGERSHRTPSWNVAPNNDKQWILRHTGSMSPIQQHFTDFLHTKRLQTLQSVDDAVEKVYQELKSLNELENTYIVYTSDNGFHLGQFGLVKGKSMPFEFDIRVPFFVRGPGVPAGATLKDIILNIDIAPTFLDIAGLKTPSHMDGSSFLPSLRALASEDNSASLIRSDKTPKSVRIPRDSFLIEKGKFSNFRTLQNHNMEQLLIPVVGKKQWLQLECQKPDYQSPCSPWQRFECYRDQENNYRIRKCRWKRKPSNIGRRKQCLCPTNTTDSESNDIHRLGIQQRVRRDEELSQRDFFLDILSTMFFDNSTSGSLSDSIFGFDTSGVFELKHLIDLAKNRGQTPESTNNTGYNSINGGNDFAKNMTIKDPKEKTYCTVEKTNLTIECHTVRARESNVQQYLNKTDLNAAIKALQKRLSELKEIRRIIKDKKRGQQAKEFAVNSVEETKFCDCSVPGSIQYSNAKSNQDITERKDNRNDRHQVRQHYLHPSQHHYPNHHRRHFRPSASALISRKFLKQLNRKKWLKKQERKLRRKELFENTTCQNSEQMNCFYHDQDHWKTPPLWNEGSFCFCQNSWNNSYWCMRTINSTHNTLFCEFITGFMLYFDMDEDPHQLRNAIYDLEFSTLEQLSIDLAMLKECSGTAQCSSVSSSAINPQIRNQQQNKIKNSNSSNQHLSSNSNRNNAHQSTIRNGLFSTTVV